MLLAFALLASSYAPQQFPIAPDPRLTPGSLCTAPSRLRFPEKIKYCERSVSGQLKDQIIQIYDSQLGFKIRQTGRSSFKIDHYIPLCLGGSNQPDNLWPQHVSVYEYTDPVEAIACKKLSEGKIKQQSAIEFLIRAKGNLQEAPVIFKTLESF